MSGKTKIEWADKVWNPVVGCCKVSEGCRHCYAEDMAKRLKAMGRLEYQDVVDEKGWTGRVSLVKERLEEPGRWKKPRRVFVNSMSDLFHPDVPDSYIHRVFQTCNVYLCHTFMILTKRPERMISRVPVFPMNNVWLGVSVENQREVEQRVPLLMQTPAAVRFVSCEPLLGAVYLEDYLRQGGDEENNRPFLQWVIAGGESGPNARPMHPDWVRSVRDQCLAAQVPFFFKQWGEWAPRKMFPAFRAKIGDPTIGFFGDYHPGDHEFHIGGITGGGVNMVRAGKKAAGRMLDGREWNEFPTQPPALSPVGKGRKR